MSHANTSNTGRIPAYSTCSIEYHRAQVERRAPRFVPHLVRTRIPWAEHKAVCSLDGSVSIRTGDGRLLALDPRGFEIIDWACNPGAMDGRAS